MRERFLVGLIGQGIGASGSPALHEEEGRELGLRVFYQLISVDGVQGLASVLDAVELAGFAGVNITHPCKQAVIPFLHELSPEARSIGAVNTVVFSGGKRFGHNTDAYGFSESFRRGLAGAKIDSVLLIGAGGAGCAVAHAALAMGIERLWIFDQEKSRAEKLVEKLGAQFGGERASIASSIAETSTSVSGLIHATPIGMATHPGMAFDATNLKPETWVADIVYFPIETELLKQARERGCRTLDGGGMAVFQAAKAFELFTSVAPDAERMLDGFKRRVSSVKSIF